MHFLSAVPTLEWPHVLLRLLVAALLGDLLDLAERGCRLIGEKQTDALSRDL